MTDDATRRLAIDVVVAVQRVVGSRVHAHLKDVKPALLQILHRKFAESKQPTRSSGTEASASTSTAPPMPTAPLAPLAPLNATKSGSAKASGAFTNLDQENKLRS